MCVIMKSESVGVRELRQNLSVYLRDVKRGQHFEVTERGRPVALLCPLPEASSRLARLIAGGRASVPVGDLVELGVPEGPVSGQASEALLADREDRI